MSLIQHLHTEFEILGTNPSLDNYGDMVKENVLQLMEVFSKQGHSGGSAPIISRVFFDLANFKLLSPLTGNDEEFSEVSPNLWQNKRNSAVFKEGDGRAYFLDAIIWRTNKGMTYAGKTKCGTTSRQYIKSFPFTPKTFTIDVIEHEVKPYDWEFQVKNPNDLDKVWEYYDKFGNA